MKRPYHLDAANRWTRMAPHIAMVGAAGLVIVGTFLIVVFAKAMIVDGFPARRGLPFILMALLFYAGAAGQLAFARWSRPTPRKPEDPAAE